MGKIQTVPLNEICETIQYGYTASAAKEPIGPKFVRITDIVPDAIDWAEVPYCQIEESKKGKYVLKSGDIVIARTGATTGYAKYLKNPPPSIFASYLVRVRVKEGVDPRYIGFVVQSDTYKRFIKTHMGGAAQPNANAKVLTSFPVPLPSFQSQKKIATILSAYDDLIENNLRRIKILEEMAQTLYREWFVKFRFPGHQKVKMVDSPLGKIPEGWEVRSLADLADVNALTVKRDEEPKEISYVDIASVSTGSIDKVQKMRFDKAPSRARRIVRHGDIIWSTVRPNRKSYSLILNPLPNLIVSTGFAVISCVNCPYTYLYHAMTIEEFVAYLTNHATGAAYPAVNQKDFEQAKIIKPIKSLIDQFHQIVEPMFELRHELAQKKVILRQTRDLLLPKFISGELDVSELDITIPEANA